MLRAVISGPVDKLDEAIRGLVLGMEFHPLSALDVFGRGELTAPALDDPYRPALSAALALLSKLGVEPQFRDFEGLGYELEDCERYILGRGRARHNAPERRDEPCGGQRGAHLPL